MEHEFAGTYPIFIDGEQQGELRVQRDGLFWLFDARCAERPELIRLSVFGGGAEGYLGLLSPEDGALRLRKRMSGAAVGAFPERLEYAAPRGCPLTEPEPEPEEAPESEKEPDALEDAASKENASPPEDSIPPPHDIFIPQHGDLPDNISINSPPTAFLENNQVVNSPPSASIKHISEASPPPSANNSANPASSAPPEMQWRSCPLPCSLFSDVEAKGAAGGIRGAMSCSSEGCTRLAVPLGEAHAIGRRSVLRFNESAQIGGRTYVICKIKNGRPV